MYKVPQYSLVAKMLDAILHPIMWFLSGFTRDSIQRTHVWNITKFTQEIEDGIGLQIKGREKSKVRQNNLGIFHMPIFGGWKFYIILERVDDAAQPWHIGWEYKRRPLWEGTSRRITMREVSVIPLKGKVKVLSGPGQRRVTFFGVDKNGEQIRLKQAGEGVNGDMKYKDIPFL